MGTTAGSGEVGWPSAAGLRLVGGALAKAGLRTGKEGIDWLGLLNPRPWSQIHIYCLTDSARDGSCPNERHVQMLISSAVCCWGAGGKRCPH